MIPVSLPKELTQRSTLKALLGCVYAYALFFGSWRLAYFLVQLDSFPLWARLLTAIPVLVIGGYGMLLMGFMGHDGTHFTLHENKITSSIIGILLTAPVFPYMVMGFTISHWNHHKFTNSENDPDSVVFSKFKNLFSRAFLARPYSFFEYGTNTVRLAFGKPLPFQYQFPLETPIVQKLAAFNVFVSLTFGLFYAWIASHNFLAFTVLVVLYLFGTVISGLSPYVEHTGTSYGRGIDTRTADGWWWDILILGNNYHLEHHLFPTVPFYNLKKAHHHLKSIGYYDQSRYFSHGAFDTYRYGLSKYPYPLLSSNS